jgi:AcrR family transcriptional regulator
MSELDRDTVITAALEMFVHRGYDTTTLADIATATRLEPDVVDAAFPDKALIVVAVLDTILAAIADELATVATADLLEALHAAHQSVLRRISAGDGPVSRGHMQRMRMLVMTSQRLAQTVSARRREVLTTALTRHFGDHYTDQDIRKAVTLWSAIAVGAYTAGTKEAHDVAPNADLLDTEQMRQRLERTFHKFRQAPGGTPVKPES